MGLVYDQCDLFRIHLQPLEDDVLKVGREQVGVVHDHNVSVFCIQAHYLIGANPLAGLGEQFGKGRWVSSSATPPHPEPGPSEVDEAVELEALCS